MGFPMKRSSSRVQVVLLAVLATVLAACAGNDTRPVIQHRDDLNYRTAATATAGADATADAGKPAVVDGRTPGTVYLPGSGELINEQLAAEPRPAIPPVGEATFNFEGESLLAVIKAILGDLLQQNYVIAPEVQGTVTLSTPRPVNADQALSLLDMARSEEHTSELQSLMRISYAVFCLTKKTKPAST